MPGCKPPRLGHDLSVTNGRLLRDGSWPAVVGGYGDLIGDSQLRRIQIQRANDRGRVATCPGMNQAAKPPPDNHIAGGDDLRPGVHIP